MTPRFGTEFNLHGALKAQTWETAKGLLRALVLIEGQKWENPNFRMLDNLVEGFITKIEDEGLHE